MIEVSAPLTLCPHGVVATCSKVSLSFINTFVLNFDWFKTQIFVLHWQLKTTKLFLHLQHWNFTGIYIRDVTVHKVNDNKKKKNSKEEKSCFNLTLLLDHSEILNNLPRNVFFMLSLLDDIRDGILYKGRSGVDQVHDFLSRSYLEDGKALMQGVSLFSLMKFMV